jgi:hypothetical protein
MRIGEIILFFAIGDLLSAFELCDDKNNFDFVLQYSSFLSEFFFDLKLCEQLKNCRMLRMVCCTMASQFRADDFGMYSLSFVWGGGVHLSLYLSRRPRIRFHVMANLRMYFYST